MSACRWLSKLCSSVSERAHLSVHEISKVHFGLPARVADRSSIFQPRSYVGYKAPMRVLLHRRRHKTRTECDHVQGLSDLSRRVTYGAVCIRTKAPVTCHVMLEQSAMGPSLGMSSVMRPSGLDQKIASAVRHRQTNTSQRITRSRMQQASELPLHQLFHPPSRFG